MFHLVLPLYSRAPEPPSPQPCSGYRTVEFPTKWCQSPFPRPPQASSSDPFSKGPISPLGCAFLGPREGPTGRLCARVCGQTLTVRLGPQQDLVVLDCRTQSRLLITRVTEYFGVLNSSLTKGQGLVAPQWKMHIIIKMWGLSFLATWIRFTFVSDTFLTVI